MICVHVGPTSSFWHWVQSYRTFKQRELWRQLSGTMEKLMCPVEACPLRQNICSHFVPCLLATSYCRCNMLTSHGRRELTWFKGMPTTYAVLFRMFRNSTKIYVGPIESEINMKDDV